MSISRMIASCGTAPCLNFKFAGLVVEFLWVCSRRMLITRSSSDAQGRSTSCEVNITPWIWCKPALSWYKKKRINTSQWTCPTDTKFRSQICHSGRWPVYSVLVFAKTSVLLVSLDADWWEETATCFVLPTFIWNWWFPDLWIDGWIPLTCQGFFKPTIKNVKSMIFLPL